MSETTEHEHHWTETTTMDDRYRQWVCVTPGCGERLTEGAPKPIRGGS